MQVEIDKMRASDAERVKKIETASNLSPWTLDDYRREADREDSLALVARLDLQIIGFIIARLIMYYQICSPNTIYTPIFSDSKPENVTANTAENEAENEIEIYNIAVDVAFRRAAVGSTLLAKLVEQANCADARRITLEVRESNSAAIDFYRRHGFETVGVRRNFYRNPVEDAVLMRLELIR